MLSNKGKLPSEGFELETGLLSNEGNLSSFGSTYLIWVYRLDFKPMVLVGFIGLIWVYKHDFGLTDLVGSTGLIWVYISDFEPTSLVDPTGLI